MKPARHAADIWQAIRPAAELARADDGQNANALSVLTDAQI
jgi:hypothetical protein